MLPSVWLSSVKVSTGADRKPPLVHPCLWTMMLTTEMAMKMAAPQAAMAMTAGRASMVASLVCHRADSEAV
ncbi:hypothetical protein PENNAL_c0007G05206 [Penicillium nalgiovense]|uniref:Uncharacterized protein n=1 Tax=Penicillium nalgiovense TaxID=60175 RepID=A0A1V6YYA4_PENNA|nr:hypothetical protein PENNAL_c0007G05206 [Penicillium nalgiovense]